MAHTHGEDFLLEGAECTGIETWIEDDVLCEAHVKLVVSPTSKVLEVGQLPCASKSTDDDSSTTRRSAGNAAGISPTKRSEPYGTTSPPGVSKLRPSTKVR
ncbi:hypothetical protein SNOG_15123 [Parastagonospora nodorum SN15]|uniref:Uncharacterized protein n=1 Tax=Phaeosphaeria nodorum (strain SN15 / ATCC MYA-4574 / FGSC 10173) TaxID=321614 RepID=Q0TYZ0_PHANO|nr:hypothetical protein SNOG_15123 [Parastagonospora nodorum SN15]EAT77348.1 hypothetical protein SNOG_15123 [Parastagonospora nodorum SN15]